MTFQKRGPEYICNMTDAYNLPLIVACQEPSEPVLLEVSEIEALIAVLDFHRVNPYMEVEMLLK